MGGGLNKGTSACVSNPRENFPDPCPSSPHPECSQFISSSSVPKVFWATASALQLRVSELWPSESICGPFKNSVFPSSSALCFSQMQSLLAFTVRCCEDSSSQHWCTGLGSLVWDWYALLFRGDLFNRAIPPDSYPPHHGRGTCLFHISTLLTGLNVVSFLYP